LDPELIAKIPGAAELIAWFGKFPRFHDGYVEDFLLRGDGSGQFRLKGWRMTDKVNSDGYFINEKYFTATMTFEKTSRASFEEFMPGQAIISNLRIEAHEDEFDIVIESSYGFSGTIRVGDLKIDFQPEAIS
jgi:hypothetical protein